MENSKHNRIHSNLENELLDKYKRTKDAFTAKQDEFSSAAKEYKKSRKEYKETVRAILEADIVEREGSELSKLKSFYYKKKISFLTEVYNAITHGLGVVFGVIALILLLFKAETSHEYLAYSIYGASIIILFLASTLYHSLSFTKFRQLFRTIDHSAIFILIAGTYTPYMLLSVSGSKGMGFLIAIWAMAVVGIVLKIGFFEQSKKLGTIIYLVMGWLCVLIFGDMYQALGKNGLILMALGGAFYSIGVIFYKNKELNFSHVIWHLFVLAGAVFMFLSIYFYV